MGIDIYMSWEEQTEEEEKAQFTGFEVSERAGGAGYLREAYHGPPYATMFFVQEAFGETDPQVLLAEIEEMIGAIESQIEKSGVQVVLGPNGSSLEGGQPDFGTDDRVQKTEVWVEEYEDYDTFYIYPAALLRERLPMACTIANYRGGRIYGMNGDLGMVEALTAFTELAERIEAEGKGPVMIRAS